MEDDMILRIGEMAIDRAETSNSTIQTSDDDEDDDTNNINDNPVTPNVEYQITHNYADLPNDTPSINVVYINIRSIKPDIKPEGKIDELKCILKMIPKTVHLILITETWLKENDKYDTSLELENYTLVLGNRVGRRGGGVAAYIREDVKYSYAEVIYSNGNNFLWVTLEEPRLNIGVVYYPGNTDEEEFLEDLKTQLERQDGNRAVILGDFNIDVLKPKKSRNLETILKSTKFYILNEKTDEYFTRKEIKKKKDNTLSVTQSIIDLVCSNLKTGDYDYHLALIDSSLSDHRQVYLEIRNPERIPKKQEQNKNVNSNWRKILGEAKKSKKAFSPLEDDIIHIVSKYSKDLKQDDWVTKEISDGITVRNLLYQEFQKTPNDETKQLFEDGITVVKKEIELKKKEHELLTLIKNRLNKIKIPSTINIDSTYITDSETICNHFNNYFSKITGFGQLNVHPDDATSSQQNIQTNRLSKMSPCTPDEISEIIISLDPHASAGICGIDVASLKDFEKEKEICNDLSTCVNKYFDAGFFPDCLKISRVMPIHESKLKTKFDNYTFELVLPVFSRILEKLIWNRLKFFVPIQYVTENQYGYQEKPNTVLRVIEIVSNIKRSIQEKKFALGLFVDLKEALDKINQSLLLKKLESLGVNDLALKIIKSYFANRKHVVTMGSSIKSDLRDIKQGVPQGSILGHLLFLIYINEVNNLNLNGEITLSSEKINLFYYEAKLEDVFEKAGQDLDTLSKWLSEKGLVVNPEKVCYVIFTNERKERPRVSDDNDEQPITNYELKYSNKKIKQAEQADFLGLIVDSKLTWTPHIQKIKTILKSCVENLKSAGQYPNITGVIFYNACVRPHTDYLIEVWGSGADAKTLDPLLVQLQEKLNVRTEALNLKQMIEYKLSILAFKTLSAYKTGESLLKVVELEEDYGKKSVNYAAALTYNDLPEEVRNCGCIDEFERKLLSHTTSTNTVTSDAIVYKCVSPKCADSNEVFKSPKEKNDHKENKHRGIRKGTVLFCKVPTESP